MYKTALGSIIVSFWFLAACVPVSLEATTQPTGQTPTTHPFFVPRTPIPAFPTADPTLLTAIPTLEVTRPLSETVVPMASLILTTTIFDEETNENWAVEASNEGILNLEASAAAHNGDAALTFSGEARESLIFQIRRESREQYEREQVLAVSFWLYGGETGIQLDDLVVQIFGSDTVFYWVQNDTSAILNLNTFSGTMLYGLGLNRDIFPDTWGKVEILLEALVYDPNFHEELVELPEYTYFTGFSIQFTEGFEGTITVDEVKLLTWIEQ